jgi:glycosyltransferase involved in cell wall biosynthesis
VSQARFSPEQISVIVCTRNRPDLLERCLDRLAALDPKPLEILLVDQSDGEESEKVVAVVRQRAPFLRRIPTSSRGLSRARNHAISAARGEILAFTDDDCLARSNWVLAIAEAFSTEPGLAAVTGSSVPEKKDCADPRILAAATWRPAKPRTFTRPIDPSVAGGGFNFSVRREWLDRVGFFDPELGAGGRYRSAEDTDMIHRLLSQGGKVRYEPKVVVAHLPWRSGHSQSAVEWEYGFGISVWALKRLALGDFFPSRVALGVLLAQGKTALGGIVRRDATAWRTGRAYLAGLGRGVASWLTSWGAPRKPEDVRGEANPGA